MEYYRYYLNQAPDFLIQAARTPEILRLKDVGMNCGCEYTSFPRFQGLAPYSRFDHSLGVALIIWRFTQDPAQALAGLLHDIATPVFAHVVDFLRGDYLAQEATEDGTAEIITSSPALLSLLSVLSLTPEEVSDYHRYPIADNDAPRLAADRLEYTLGNCINYRICRPETVKQFYDDLVISQNELGLPELSFQTPEIAERFAFAALDCAEIYVADEDRYAMQTLADLLRYTITTGVLTDQDLFTTESEVIQKLNLTPDTAARWKAYRAMNYIEQSDSPQGEGWRKIQAKKRRIDPLIFGHGRVSIYSQLFSDQLREFEYRSQDYWIRGIERR